MPAEESPQPPRRWRYRDGALGGVGVLILVMLYHGKYSEWLITGNWLFPALTVAALVIFAVALGWLVVYARNTLIEDED